MTAPSTPDGGADGGWAGRPARPRCSCGEPLERVDGGWAAVDPVLWGLDWGDHQHAPATPPSPPTGRCGCGAPVTQVRAGGRLRWLDPAGVDACPGGGEHQAAAEVVPEEERCTAPGCVNRGEYDGLCPPCDVLCAGGEPWWDDFTPRGELIP